jgi:hypothetical protein
MKRTVKIAHILCTVLVLSVLVFVSCGPGGLGGTTIPLSSPDSSTFEIEEDTFILTWDEVSEAAGYIVSIVSIDGVPEENSVGTPAFSLERLTLNPKKYQISVKAIAASNSAYFTDSGYSDSITVETADYIFDHSGKEPVNANIRQAVPNAIAITGLTAYGKTLPNIVIPEKIRDVVVKIIEATAFAGSGIVMESVVIPATITEIQSGAFAGRTEIKSITFAEPVDVTAAAPELDLPADVFQDCTEVETIIVPTGSSEDTSFMDKIKDSLPPSVVADNPELIQEEDDIVEVTGVSLTPTSKSLVVGETLQLTATVTPLASSTSDGATNKSVTWSSNNTRTATVDRNGLVQAIGAGTATITVTTVDGGFTARCNITVAQPVVPDPSDDVEYKVTITYDGFEDSKFVEVSENSDGNPVIALMKGFTLSAWYLDGEKQAGRIRFDGLFEGEYFIKIVAVDEAGVPWSNNLTVEVRTATEPGDDDSEYQVTITVEDFVDVVIADYSNRTIALYDGFTLLAWYLDGVKQDGNISFGGLSEGMYRIKVVAEDEDGVPWSNDFNVEISTDPQPGDDSEYQVTITVEDFVDSFFANYSNGTVTLLDGFTLLAWYLDGEKQDDGIYLGELPQGEYSVKVVAADENGVPYSNNLTITVQ